MFDSDVELVKDYLFLQTWSENIVALNLYKACGFLGIDEYLCFSLIDTMSTIDKRKKD